MNKQEWESLAPTWLWRSLPGLTLGEYVDRDERISYDWVLFGLYRESKRFLLFVN